MSKVKEILGSRIAKKAYVVAAYALLGALVKAEVISPEVEAFLRDNALEMLFVTLGLGHVIPEAAKAGR